MSQQTDPFGAQLREWRTDAHLTQSELATLAGVDFSYISKIENGRNRVPPSEELLRKLAGFLNVDTGEMLRLSGHTIKIPIAEYERLKTLEEKVRELEDENMTYAYNEAEGDAHFRYFVNQEVRPYRDALEDLLDVARRLVANAPKMYRGYWDGGGGGKGKSAVYEGDLQDLEAEIKKAQFVLDEAKK